MTIFEMNQELNSTLLLRLLHRRRLVESGWRLQGVECLIGPFHLGYNQDMEKWKRE